VLTMLDEVYFDAKETRSIVAIKPKPAFMPIFQVATTREGSDVVLMKDLPPALPPEAGPMSPCCWWRRGGESIGNNLHKTLKVLLPNVPT